MNSLHVSMRPGKLSPALLAGCAVCLAVFLLYSPVFEFSFINYDDPEYILSNRHVNTGVSLENIRWALTARHSANWHPLTWVSHMVDVQLFGSSAGGHHGVNLLIHLLSGWALFLLIRSFTIAPFVAVGAVLLFLVHPVRVETVAWVSQRKELLCLLFGLLSLWRWVSFVQRERKRDLVLTLLFFAAAALSKPMAVVIAPLSLICVWWLAARGDVLKGVRAVDLIRKKRVLVAQLLLWGGAALLSVITVLAQSGAGAIVSATQLPMWVRLLRVSYHYLLYARMLIFPWPLNAFYRYEQTGVAVLLAAALIVLSVLYLCIRFRSKCPMAVGGVLWFGVALVPVIGLVQVGAQPVAERYLSFAFAGVLIAAAGVYERLSPRRLVLWAGGMLGVAAIWSALTFHYLPVWGSSPRLYSHVLARDSLVVPALGNLAVYYDKTAEPFKALPLARKAWQSGVQPVHTGLVYGAVLLHLDSAKSARAVFEQVLNHDPANAQGWYNLALSSLALGDSSSAFTFMQRSTELDKTFQAAVLSLGDLHLARGLGDSALVWYDRLLQLNPGADHARLGKALSLTMLGECAAARGELSGLLLSPQVQHEVLTRLIECENTKPAELKKRSIDTLTP